MGLCATLIDELIAKKRLAPLELVGLPEAESFDATGFAFVGARRHCGMMLIVALVRADGLRIPSAANSSVACTS